MRAERWREWLWPGVAVLALAAIAAWLVAVTEWADTDFYVPAKGEAARNRLYAAQALARDLGAQVTVQTSFDPLPPPGATLVLTSAYWDLLPGRQQALRDWVRQGGQLVISSWKLDDDALSDWLPVRQAKAKFKPESKPKAEAESESQPQSCSKPDGDCHYLSESGASAGPGFRICSYPWLLELKPGAASLWSADNRDGQPEILRAAFGQGSVTAIGIWNAITEEDVLKADHAQAWVAALGLRPGMALWFIGEESRNALPAWLWRNAWAALLLGLLALAAWLWRGAPRFGPALALPRLERRSMAEQIVGTAHFLARSDAPALHRAQLRALNEAAAPRLHRWAKLDLNARARAVAAVTGLRTDAVAQALAEGVARPPARLEADLCCLETAARRLRAGAVQAALAYPSS